MKYHILAIIHILIFFNPVYTYADTVLTNSLISTNTTLLKSKSPYVLNQNVTIAKDTTLTIEEGVTLIFNQGGGLFINAGSLIGKGFKVESESQNYNFLIQCNACLVDIETVTVSGVPRSFVSAWNGSNVKLNNISIDFDSKGSNITGIQVFNNTSLTVTNSSFSRLTKAFDIFNFSTSSITNSFFTYNDHAIYTFDSSVDVHESDFEYNHIAIEFFANLDIFPIVDAHNNWWGQGDVSPVYRDDSSQVQQADTNAIVGVVIYAPWSTSPHKDKIPIDGLSNVLFFPGLMGSRLYKKDIVENQLWEPNRNKDVTKLFLDVHGKSIENAIYTRDIISTTNIVGGVTNIDQAIYKDFSGYMNQLVKTNTINSWKAAPYDWRYSSDTILLNGITVGDGKNYTTMNLVSEIKLLAKNSKSKRVTLITHSNGGLVAKQLMIELKKQKLDTLVDKIIFVAFPEYGTPQAITSLLYGHEQSIANGLILKAETAKSLGVNMPSAYTLLPSEKYFLGGKPIFIDGIKIHNKTELNSVLAKKSNINHDLLLKADVLRMQLDAWIPPTNIPVYQIVGTGLLTVSGLMKNSEGNPLPQYSSSGDGVVQDMYNQSDQVFYRTGKVFIADIHSTKFKHANIMNFTDTMKYVDLLIRKNPTEAGLIPYGKYQIYPDTFSLFTLSSSHALQLSQKTIQIEKDEAKDVLNHSSGGQFDFSLNQNSEGRFDLFDKNIQYITQTPIKNLQVTDSLNDSFDIFVYQKTVEGMTEIQYEDIKLFQDSILSLNFIESNTDLKINIDLPYINQSIHVLPTKQNAYSGSGGLVQSATPTSTTTHAMDIVERITQIKESIKISNITGYIKSRYTRRLDTIIKSRNENAFMSLKRSLEEGIRAIDRFTNNQILRQKYAKLKQDYIYIVYLLK